MVLKTKYNVGERLYFLNGWEICYGEIIKIKINYFEYDEIINDGGSQKVIKKEISYMLKGIEKPINSEYILEEKLLRSKECAKLILIRKIENM